MDLALVLSHFQVEFPLPGLMDLALAFPQFKTVLPLIGFIDLALILPQVVAELTPIELELYQNQITFQQSRVDYCIDTIDACRLR